MNTEKDLNLDETELRLGLPGTHEDTLISVRNNKRHLSDAHRIFNSNSNAEESDKGSSPPSKAPVVGWPPVRSFRRNQLQQKSEAECAYVKVSKDGAPYLRKIQLKVYEGYPQLLKALEDMFQFKAGQYSEKEGYNGSEYIPTYEDKDGDWMLIGDVPWEMFTTSCRRMRVMKESEAKGLGCAL